MSASIDEHHRQDRKAWFEKQKAARKKVMKGVRYFGKKSFLMVAALNIVMNSFYWYSVQLDMGE